MLSRNPILALSVAVALVSAPLFAQDDEHVTPHREFQPLPREYAKSFEIGDATGLSGMLLFTARIDDYDRIMVLDLNSSRVRRVIDGPGNNSFASFSPDGSQIIFTSDRDGNREIYLAHWDGTAAQRLTNNTLNDDNASWSPDGTSIVYYSETGQPTESDSAERGSSSQSNLFTMNIVNKSAKQLTKFSKRNTTPVWSPDGKLIAFSTNRYWPGWDICVIDTKTREERCPLSGAQSYCRPHFDPSGSKLAYSIGTLNDIDLGVYNLKTGNMSAITSMPGREYDAIWSPEGALLAFTAENGAKEVFNIYVITPPPPEGATIKSSAEGGNEVRHLVKSPYSLRFLSWTKAKAFDLEGNRIREMQKG